MKFVLLLWCFVVNVNILLSQIALLKDYLLEEENILITKCSQNISVNGGRNLTLYPKEKCNQYKIRLISLNEASTFNLSAEIRSNEPSEQDEAISVAVKGTLEVQIYETSRHRHDVLRATWNETESLSKQKYLSYNTAVLIEVAFSGNWANNHLVIFPEEIIFQNCSKNITVDGGRKLVLYPTVKCDSYAIRIFSLNETSIFNLSAEIRTNEPSDHNEIISDTVNGTIEVQIYETIHQNGNYDVLRETWNETKHLSKQKYLSRNSALLIEVVFSGDWTDNQVVIFSEEFKYRMCMLNIAEKTKHKFSDQLTPNIVNLYLLQGGSSEGSIQITLHELNINTTVGDYLLIGSGTEPFQDHPPLFVMQAKSHSKFYVVDKSAYVAFVTGPSVAERSINISWEHTAKKSDDENPTEDPRGVLNSTEICFYNVEAALSELENSEQGRCSNFRIEFFDEAKNYTVRNITEESLRRKFENLNCSSVVLQSLESNPNSSLIYARIQVKSEGKSLLTWKHLENIINEFSKKNYTSVQQLQIRSCPKERDNLSYLIYFSVPVFAVFFITIWAYQQKVFQQQCTPPKTDVQMSTDSFRAEPNPYGRTPKVYQEDEFGRRQTLVQENLFDTQVKEIIQSANQSIMNDERGPIEIGMTEISENPSVSRDAGSSRRIPNFPRSKRRPSLQSMINQRDQSEEGSFACRNEVTEDHVYDSLNSRAEEIETQL